MNLKLTLHRILRIVSGTLLLAGGAHCSYAEQPSRTAAGGQEIAYDIPSQSLAAALNAYAAASGIQVLYETSLTANRNSTAVKGRLTPDAALLALLAGTGLSGRRTDIDAVTILRAGDDISAGTSSPAPPDARFLGALQASILSALCGKAETRPGTYRMALQLWITPAGAIQRASLLGSTGDAERDATFVAALAGVTVGARPPAGMGLPVTLAVVPRSPLKHSECVTR